MAIINRRWVNTNRFSYINADIYTEPFHGYAPKDSESVIISSHACGDLSRSVDIQLLKCAVRPTNRGDELYNTPCCDCVAERLRKIDEVYERFKHLDRNLTDEKLLLGKDDDGGDNITGYILFDLWQAIRNGQ